MLRENTVFGPIKSRRLGWSLGINLLPTKGKICNFDCIYCECGWNADGREDLRMPSAKEVHDSLKMKLEDILLNNTHIDSITFSGDGEPTLNPEFGAIIEDTILLRDTFYPKAKISVLTNATRLLEDSVFNALKKVDAPILKLDAPSDELAKIINGALPSYKIEDVIKGIIRFNGDFILQTMFLKAPSFDSLKPDVLHDWMNIVRRIKPRLIMAYTIARPTPATGLLPYSEGQIAEALKPLADEGFKIQINC